MDPADPHAPSIQRIGGCYPCVAIAALWVGIAAGAEPWRAPDLEVEHVLGLNAPFEGDLDEMLQRGVVRMLVAYNRTHYFIDGARPRGITYEAGEGFQAYLRKGHPAGPAGLDVVYIAVPRDELLERLRAGFGDIAAANLAVTEGRQREVDFSAPLIAGTSEVWVSAPGSAPAGRIEDLAGREVTVRESSSYYESLLGLNARFAAEGRAPIRVRLADDPLEDEDLLELTHAGVLAATVVNAHLAEFWRSVLPGLRVHHDIALRTDVEIAWAIRKDSPRLKGALDAFLRANQVGSLLGNVVYKRYLEANRWVRNPDAGADRARYESMRGLFQEYGDRYGFDGKLIAALAYQESGLVQSKRSPEGAIGVMQLLKSTAASREVDIPEIEDLEANIQAGARYLRVLVDRYFSDPELDELHRHLFATAAYNAGPSRITRMRQRAADEGLNPNLWFGNVEQVVARDVGREPVNYVRGVYKNFVAYRLEEERRIERDAARANERERLGSPQW